VEQLARLTRVAPRFLEALESDDLSTLPPAPFTKGFIRAYCQMLGEPPDEALALYERSYGKQSSRAGTGVAAPRAFHDGRGRGAVLVSFVLLLIFGVALFAVTIALQSGRGDGVQQRASAPSDRGVPEQPVLRPAPSGEVPVPGAVLMSRAGEAPASVPVPSPPSPPPPAPVATVTAGAVPPYRLLARTTDTTWIRVRMEDGRSTEETVPAGEVREWVSNRRFVVTIGNAAGVTLALNGHVLPPLGRRGEVIARLVLPPEAR
jgi:hypothetical protein